MLLDSNILIRYLNGEEKIVEQLNTWRIDGQAFHISSITRAEVLSLRTLTDKTIQQIKDFLETFVSVPLVTQDKQFKKISDVKVIEI